MTETAFNKPLFIHCPQLMQFLAALPIGVAVVESDGSTYLNPAGRTLLGKETGDWEELRSREKTDCGIDQIEVCREGHLISVAVRTIPILDDQGKILYTLLTLQEILSPDDQERCFADTAKVALQESEAKFQKLAENIPGVIYRYVLYPDGSDRVTYISPRTRELHERDPQAVLQDSRLVFDLVHPDDAQSLQASILKSAQTLQPWRWEGRIITPSGCLKWVQGFSHPECKANGEIVWDGLLIDMTDRHTAEAALRDSEARFRSLAENLPGMIYRYILHADGTDEFTYLSPHCYEIYEIEAAVMMQNTQLLWGAVYPDDMRRVQGTIADALQNPKSINLEHRVTTPSGQVKWIQVIAQPDIQPNGDSVWDGVTIDITSRKLAEQLLADYNRTLEQQVQSRTLELQQEILERKRAEEVAKAAESALRQANLELERLASLDSLTQVANRRSFTHYLSQQWQQMQREQKPLSLILCDVDYFKRYNDHYGHQEGDRCLQLIAKAMNQVVKRAIDLVARYGGEEFTIILPNTDLTGAIYIAEDIRETVQRLQISHAQSEVSSFVTVSFGVASLIPTIELSPETLISESDRALYRAKRAGRNCTIAGLRDEVEFTG